MAETTTAAAATANAADGLDSDKKAITRPTRPDEDAFKEELSKAEKTHKEAMDRLVCN